MAAESLISMAVKDRHMAQLDILFSLFATGYWSIQCPNKILTTICLAVGKFTKDLSFYFFSVETLNNND